MVDINYSILIPHKNIPELLQRCLDSIPVRDDIQVIVVDDNSDPRIVNFKQFPKWRGKNYISIMSKTNLFAGGARNEGLKYAKGEWITCLDADDILTEKANEIFSKYQDNNSDVILLGIESRDCTTLMLAQDEHWYMQIMHMNIDPKIKMLELTTSCAKFIKLSLIVQNSISFSSDKHHNDTLFFTKVAIASKFIESHPEDLFYVWARRDGSLSNTINFEEITCHFNTDTQKFRLIKKAGFQSEIGNYQMEHLRKWKSIPVSKQIPLLAKMFTSGMLFNKSKLEPIKTREIIWQIMSTLKKGIVNQFSQS